MNNELDCQNGGSCKVVKGKSVCICKKGFYGKTCDLSTTSLGSWTANVTGKVGYL